MAHGQDQLDNVTVITESLSANDIVYDRRRDVIYASIGSSAGVPNGNSIVTLDPETLEVLDHIFVGSEPNLLAISNDSSRVYIHLEGASAIRYYEPATKKLGPLQTLTVGETSTTTAFAEDMIVSPRDPKTLLVSLTEMRSRNRGNIAIFNDSGQVGSVNDPSNKSTTFTFVDADTVIGVDASSSGINTTRYSFDGNSLTPVQTAQNFYFFANTFNSELSIRTVGGMIYTNRGDIVDPVNLSIVERLRGSGLRQAEASDSDQLIYITGFQLLKVYSLDSYELLDETPLEATGFDGSDATTIDFAGRNRLAYTTREGVVGIISGIQFSPPPLPRINIEGTSEDDWVTFNSVTREISVNGVVTSIPFETTKIHFYGKGGIDHVTFVGDPDEDEFAVLQGTEMTVSGVTYFFAAHDVAELEFESTSRSDTCVIFDSDAQERLTSTPTLVQLMGDVSLHRATNVQDVYIFSSGGDDSASMRGSDESERVNSNMQSQLIRMTGDEFFQSLSGFGIVRADGGVGETDFANVVDSSSQDIAYFRSDFGRFLNDTTDYTIRGFEKANFWSGSGRDIGIFQKTLDSNVSGNGTWETLAALGYQNTTFGLRRLIVREP